MAKGTPLTKLNLSANTINRLHRAGIRSIEQLSKLPIDKLKAVHSLSRLQCQEIRLAYGYWFAETICKPIPPLPVDWKPCTQTEAA